MSEPFLGQIIQGGWNFAPRGYHICDGSLLSISQNAALFSLLGTYFGGNGTSTFGLPDLRSRRMVGTGQGPGLSNYSLGEMTGTENTTLLVSNMPSHTHTATLSLSSSFGATTTKGTAGGNVPANGSILAHATDGASPPAAILQIYAPSGTAANVALGGLNVSGSVANALTGSGIPFPHLDPVTAVTTVIALVGIFPTRS
jgi:microcystin-dependent protein